MIGLENSLEMLIFSQLSTSTREENLSNIFQASSIFTLLCYLPNRQFLYQQSVSTTSLIFAGLTKCTRASVAKQDRELKFYFLRECLGHRCQLF